MYKKYGKDAAWAYNVNKYYGLIKKGWQCQSFLLPY
jgi:hypothetical protein